MKFLANTARVLVGLLFIFSGFIKANDPLGFGYKLQEYFEVFNMHWMIPLCLFLAIFICIFEVAVGFALLIGARLKLVLWLLSIMMVFFTFLTFYSAYYNKVTSCGCFGDAIPLTPWQSFYKDVILCTLTLIIIIGRSHVNALFGPRMQSAALWIFTIAATAFPIYTSTHLPVIDFRPYKIGTNLYRAIHPKEKFFYMLKDKKTGEQKEFESWPPDWDKQYDFVSSRTEPLDKTIKPITGFSIASTNGEDHTDEFLTQPGCSFILVEYDLDRSNRAVQGRINDLAELCKKDNISFIALTSSDTTKIKSFRKEVNAAYDFYMNPDEVPLKTIIRSNPGLVMMKDSVVTAMWPYRTLPSYNDVKAKYFGKQ
jgi:uncharacterized membrane protein YphA (DoxX/SURF4 family)